MMKRVLLMCCMTVFAVSVMAQDFASRFLDGHKEDENLKCVTISPKMMEEIMNNDADKNEEMIDIISNLKSMQMLTADVKGQEYYDDALKIVEKNSKRFESFLSFDGESENCRILVRKKNKSIIELVMLVRNKNHFMVVNFTGNMSPEFIDKLTASMKKGS